MDKLTTRNLAIAVAVVWMVVAALLLALVLPKVLDAGAAKPVKPMTAYSDLAGPKPVYSPSSCFWTTKGVRKWCIDEYATEYANHWTNDDGWNEPWEITQYEGNDRRYYVYNHRDELDGYLRPTPWGWRAMLGSIRAGKAVRVSRNVYRVYSRGKVVGSARGPDAVGVVAYELVKGFDHEQYWTDGKRR
jgi:hypothetical protein